MNEIALETLIDQTLDGEVRIRIPAFDISVSAENEKIALEKAKDGLLQRLEARRYTGSRPLCLALRYPALQPAAVS